MKQLLIATNNHGKIEELRSLLARLPAAVLTPAEIGLSLAVVEDGATYAENAGKKARSFAGASGLASLADDTGLEVNALGGAPGLFSKRYAGRPDATDADRRAHLLLNLRDIPRPWLAVFRATIAVATPAGELRFAEGTCQGEVIPSERGSGGFGYDAIFMPAGAAKTIAEMTMVEKNLISHRARAVRQAWRFLPDMLRD